MGNDTVSSEEMRAHQILERYLDIKDLILLHFKNRRLQKEVFSFQIQLEFSVAVGVGVEKRRKLKCNTIVCHADPAGARESKRSCYCVGLRVRIQFHEKFLLFDSSTTQL